MIDSINLAYRTGQSADLTVIGNPVFTLSRDLSFPYHVINGPKGVNSAYLLFHRFPIWFKLDFTLLGHHFSTFEITLVGQGSLTRVQYPKSAYGPLC